MEGTLSISSCPFIKVVSVDIKDLLGSPTGKDSVTAYYKVIVEWCDPEIDEHLTELDPESFKSKEEISVEAWSRNDIKPGLYKRLDQKEKIFERVEQAA